MPRYMGDVPGYLGNVLSHGWRTMLVMTQTVELLLDEATENAVRAHWSVLAAAGLPSQARHTAPSNRPHVTLVAQDEIADAAEPGLVEALADLPIPVRLGALTCFGRGPFILVRPLVADIALLRLQQRVQEAAGEPRPPSPLMRPGHWVPHVTLARRMSADQVGLALTVLSGIPEGSGGSVDQQSYAVSARRWDGTAKREWPLR